MPPSCARAIARRASVTVSIAAETSGRLRRMLREREVARSVSRGRTVENAGTSSTSSKVSALPRRRMRKLQTQKRIIRMQVQSTALRTRRRRREPGPAGKLAATFHAVHHDHGSTVASAAARPPSRPSSARPAGRGAVEVEGQGRPRPVQRPAAAGRHPRPGHPVPAERAPQQPRRPPRRRSAASAARRRPRRRRRRAPPTPSSRPSARRPKSEVAAKNKAEEDTHRRGQGRQLHPRQAPAAHPRKRHPPHPAPTRRASASSSTTSSAPTRPSTPRT